MKISPFLMAFLLFFIFSNNGVHAQANRINFRQISPPGGFTLDGINTIIQDDLGYMWMGTREGLIKYDSKNTNWITFPSQDSLNSLSGEINDIYSDASNDIWLATKLGLLKFDRQNQKFKHIEYTYENGAKSNDVVWATLKTENNRLLIADDSYFGYLDLQKNQFVRIGEHQINAPINLYKDNSNRIWIGTATGDVFRFFPSKNRCEKVISNTAKVNSIYSVNEEIWIGTDGEGAKLYNLKGKLIKQVSFGTSSNNSYRGHVRVIKKDTYGRLWFGAYEGLFMDDGHQLTQFKTDDYSGLPHNSIYEIYEDKQGALWIGTWSGGVALIHHSDNNFKTYRHNALHNSISNNMVSSFLQIDKNELLIGTEVGGLNSFNLTTEEFTRVELSNTKQIVNIKELCKDKQGGVWVGTLKQGLWYRPAGSKKFKLFDEGPQDGKHISSNGVFSLCAVDSGVWIGTFEAGINFYSFKTKSIRYCFRNNTDGIPMSNIIVQSIVADSKSNLWLGSLYGFLYKVHLPSGRVTKIADKEFATKYKNISIFHLWERNSDELWMGSKNKGLLIYHRQTNTIETFDTNGILKGKNVYGIIEDRNKQLWITSNNGLILYNPENKTKRYFAYSDGIQSNIFCPQSVYHDDRDNLFFGGSNGFTKINPNHIKTNVIKPYTTINKLITKNNVTIYPNYSDNFEIVKVTLQAGESSIRFNFSANNYLMPEKNKYKYRLINYYDDWIDNKNEGSVLFNSLSAGNYIFEVKACNNDGIWSTSPTRMEIEIQEFWYKTTCAYLAYFLLFSLLLYFTSRFYLEKTKLRRAVAREKTERENEEHIHEMKLKFFTNISHEFRTPLTLILWPLKKLLSADNISDEQREELEVAQRNSNRLLQLINQIVDLRKLEKEKSKLNLSKVEVINFIKEMQLDFASETKLKEINFVLDSPYSSLEIEADLEKLDTIIYNLLSNAYKYVSDKGEIKITVDKTTNTETNRYSNQLSFGEIQVDDFIQITIEDTGLGIENEDLLRIFTRFEQGRPPVKSNWNKRKGSGIGLSMCKEFTLLHHGKIMVQSNLGEGSRFTILLPTKQSAQKILFESHQKINNLNVIPPVSIPQKEDIDPKNKKHLLVVEDNLEFSNFITKYLSQFYRVDSANNGTEALSILKQKSIDLVISDVMMPQMDGFEFCSLVKTQIETSHIPVILLTALSSSENLIAGLDKGADAYLTKPFEENVLVKQIENILEQRKRIHQNFGKQFISQKTVEVSSLDNFFLNRVRDVIEKNISDEDFNMDKLAEDLLISRSKLHRKIKSLSGVTTSEFVNLVRIKKAVELINKENYLFSEVAYQVGFSSQSYFNRCFKKVYNTTPKQYFSKNKK